MYLQVISLVVLNIGTLSLNMWRLRIKQKQRKFFALSFARMVIKKSKWTHCWLHKEVLVMYEKSLLCGIMNDWYGRMEDLVADLEGYGFEVLESNREYMDVLVEEDGEVIEVQLFLGGTERTITVEDFEEIRREEA